MLFINFLCLLYLMVLADSHTISKSIDNDKKLDKNIFESIHDVDRPPINPKTRKDRQHNYKLYYHKDEDVVLPEALKETKPSTGLEKRTAETTRKTTSEHVKHQKSSKRRVGGFWRKLKGKMKRKETTKHKSFERKRTVANHKKKQQKDSSNLGPKNKSWRNITKKFSLRQPEIKVRKRDASGLCSTKPYSNTPQSYKLQMGVAPNVDNMLRSNYESKVVQPTLAVNAREGVTENLKAQLASFTTTVADLKEKYFGKPLVVEPLSTKSPSADNAETIKRGTTVSTTEVQFDAAQIEFMLNNTKARVMHSAPFQKPLVTDFFDNFAAEVTSNAYPNLTSIVMSDPSSSLSTFVSINETENLERTTVASTKSDEFNPNDYVFSVTTEAHYLAVRSIKDDTITIAQNVEDMLQRELKNIYNKVKHKVSSDLRKELHTIKSTAKESYQKLSSKLSSTCKAAANATTSKAPSKITSSQKPKTCPCKYSTKRREQLSTTTTTTITTAPRVKKKDHTGKDMLIEDNNTPETVNKQTYDDYLMLTLFEQILSKVHEENVRKMLATTEYPVSVKNKKLSTDYQVIRSTRNKLSKKKLSKKKNRLSKRNPETLTDVKLREVIQNLYDDGGNMPDYDYMDPSSSVSSTKGTTANDNYNDVDYVLDPSATADNSADSFMVEVNDKNKGATSTPTDDNADHADDGDLTDHIAADSGNIATATSYEGLSNKIYYNKFVNGYKHYLNFQKDQNNQNFSNLVKYQAHKHHSVDDIGKFILNKLPPLPSHNKKKREQTFSDDSENNMDDQDITTKNDDSWFRKHFYLFIDNGPPKKYHTSQTVELKPPSTEPILYMTSEPAPRTVHQLFNEIGSDSVPRKVKHSEEISLEYLDKLLDSLKEKYTSDTSTKALYYVLSTPNIQKDIFNPIDNYNSTNDVTSWDKSIISKFFAGKRRHAPTKGIETTEYFPDDMFAVSTQQGRLKRSVAKENLENTIMADFINKDIEEKASTGAKEVLTNAFSNRGTNKFGYVDIDLVPRPTAIVKLRNNAKKSRIKNFFMKFKFKKKKAINPKLKRSYPEIRRRQRFSPIKKLKSMFTYKEDKEKNKGKDKYKELVPDRFMNSDYDNMAIPQMGTYKPEKFSQPLSIADMQLQIPNISDIYFEPESNKMSTKLSTNYHLDDKDLSLLSKDQPATPSSKPLVASNSKPDSQTDLLSFAHNGQARTGFTDPYRQPTQQRKETMLQIMTIGRTNATKASSEPLSLLSTTLKASTKKKSQIQKIPPSNVMTVNVRTLRPSTATLMITPVSLMTNFEDVSLFLDNLRNKLKKKPENSSNVTTEYTTKVTKYTNAVQRTGKNENKKIIDPLEELLIKSKLTRIAKFPIGHQRYKNKRHDSEVSNIGKDYLSFDGSSVLEFIHNLGIRNSVPERRKGVKGNAMRKMHHSHAGKASMKDKSRYTDYFNDLIMWNNDILNLDTVPNWANVLKTAQSEMTTSYTTSNMNSLLIGLKEMNDYIDAGHNVNGSAMIISPNYKSLDARWEDRVGMRDADNQMNDLGIIRSVAMDDNTVVTSKDMLIKGEAKYYQYSKPKDVATKLSSSDFKKILYNYDKNKEKIQFKRKGGRYFFRPLKYSEPDIIVDPTLMAYDDDVDSAAKTLEAKNRRSRKQMAFKGTKKTLDTRSPFLKTNKRPVQYYSTPLPMKSSDFYNFLKEHHMDVEFVTSPIYELPTIKTFSTHKKYNEPKPTTITSTKSTFAEVTPHIWKAQVGTRLAHLSNPDELFATKKVKTTKKKGFTQQLQSKIEHFTNAVGKSVKFTSDHPKKKKEKQNLDKHSDSNDKNYIEAPYMEDDFERYKRYRVQNLRTMATPATLNKTTQEANYYRILKKKMKERLFEKKAIELVDSPTTEPMTAEPPNKDVEITIINFDEMTKLTNPQPVAPLTLATLPKDEIGTYANYDAVTTKPDNRIKSSEFSQKEEMVHNGLLFVDNKGQTSSSATPTKFSPINLIKSTEPNQYVELKLNTGPAVNNNKPMVYRFQFENIPMFPNISVKLPHAKNLNNVPKRVHISSHHYKYDVFYDDFKRMGKFHEGQGLRPSPPTTAQPSVMSPITQLASTRTEAEVVKNIERSSPSNRQKRKIWGRDAAHKKRKSYTILPTSGGGGVTESAGYFTTPIILTPLNITGHAEISGTWDEETYTLAEISTALISDKPYEQTSTSEEISSALVSDKPYEQTSTFEEISSALISDKPYEQTSTSEEICSVLVSDKPDEQPYASAVTMMAVPDRQVMGVNINTLGIEDAVVLSAVRTEYLTSAAIRESLRDLLSPSTAAPRMPATKPATKATTKAATKPATKHTTKHVTKFKKKPRKKPAKKIHSQLGPLVYNQTQLKLSTKSSKPTKGNKVSSGVEKDRHRRLFRISALIPQRLKSLMNNLTRTTKQMNATTTATALTNITTQSPKLMPIRRDIVFGSFSDNETKPMLEDKGFHMSYRPNGSTEQTLLTQDKFEDVTSVSFLQRDYPIYVEPQTYNDQQYYELGSMKSECLNTTQAPKPCSELQMTVLHSDVKREVQNNTFTAKNVAALEVIVDLMKKLSYEDNMPGLFPSSRVIMPSDSTKSVEASESNTSNSLHLHIAIPLEFQNGKKRSPSVSDPFRVRKVFSAKMSTPVDLEYQVNSYEEIAPTSTSVVINSTTDTTLSPGMYLLVDNPRDSYALKPVLGQINLADLRARQMASGTTVSMTESKPIDTREETTSMKNLAKVTLSKDFVAAINQQLIAMSNTFHNLSRVNKDVNDKNITRSARSVWKSRKLKENKEERKTNAEKYSVRHIDWEAVKQFFGHERACTCKCENGKPMCRACAASEAVIDELIFEFDNIGRYMADHCTEIQTFFWMNPTGGQRLRESVNKIDKSLSDYYKRVKGKCKGRLCKCFSTYIDKRHFAKTVKAKKEDTMSRLINDLAGLAEDLDKTVSLNVCYNERLEENGRRFLHFMKDCFIAKPVKKNKRSNPNTTTKKLIKNVYSLDNINVNIICNPEPSRTTDLNLLSYTIPVHENPRAGEHILFDYDIEEPVNKTRKGLKKIFPQKKKLKLLSFFNKRAKTQAKRQVDNQVATPLISDSGGAFWYDYLKSGTNEPRLARDSIKDTSNTKITVVQKGVTTEANLSEKPSNYDVSTIYTTAKTLPERNQRDIVTTTDSLSRNINQMLQLFGNLQDVETMDNNLSQRAMMLRTESVIGKAVSQDKPMNQSLTIVNETVIDKAVPEVKPRKQLLTIIKNVKQKMDRAWSKEKPKNFTVPRPGKQNKIINRAPDKKSEELQTIEQRIHATPHYNTSINSNATTNLKPSDDGFINSMVTVNVRTIKMTAAISPVTDKTLDSTYSVEKNNTRPATNIAPSDGISETPLISESTTKLGFIQKLKMFKKEKTSQTKPKHTTATTTLLGTKIPSTFFGIIDIVKDSDKKNKDHAIQESSQRTSENPTILIINDDYGNHISSENLDDGSKEGDKNLLLSIIQFETNSLNDEWDRVAYGVDRHRDETDMKRHVTTHPKVETVKPPLKPTFKTMPPAETTNKEGGSSQDTTSTKEPEGLLNKIVSKMGIKVISNKNKVVKKPSTREVKRERKRNFIRNRKLRTHRKGNPISPRFIEEACHSRRTAKPSQLCDIKATCDYIQKLQRSLPATTFETLVRNITCYKYINADSIFTIPYKKQGKRWDWIRKTRSLKVHFYNKPNKDEHDLNDDAFVVNYEDDSPDSYEKFVKGGDGIYKIVQRNKRTANLEALERGLRNIPTLMPGENEVFVMLGDSVTLDCGLLPVHTYDEKFKWKTDRKRMLRQDNVYVDGVSVNIHNVEPRNVGTYTCSLDRAVRQSLSLSVMTVPSFDVVFLPVYKTVENCSYDDLKAIQRLGGLMANEIRCGRACSIRIDEPVCQRDKGTNSTLLRATAVISLTPRELNCSLQCKRDIVSSLVLLCATNSAILSSIRVLVSKDGVNETLEPWKDLVRPVVTHTLRKKDTNGHHEYHELVPLLSPGKANVVVICPAGYYLLPRYKLCSSCPLNTSSKAGDNICRSCPRGTRAEPGAAKCHIVKTHPRRYDWWWYPPCGYLVACCGVLFGCSACVVITVIMHVVSRDSDLPEDEDGYDEEHKIPKSQRPVTVAHAHAGSARPLSPSRVILPRFFRPSLTSSRATDSQETKFELWKERNRPPPLPPIDFDP